MEPDLVPAGGIGNPGDFFAVRRDGRIAVIPLPGADLFGLAPGNKLPIHLAKPDAPDIAGGIFLLRNENQGPAVRIPDRIQIVSLVEGDLPVAGAGGAANPDIKIIGLPGDIGQIFSVRRESRGEVNIGMGGHLLQVEGLSRGCSRGWSSRLHRRVHRGGRLCEKAGH